MELEKLVVFKKDGSFKVGVQESGAFYVLLENVSAWEGPPVSVGGLSRRDLQRIIEALQSILKDNPRAERQG